jgi:O-antigen/teichoic acid export membrane protein
VKSVWILLNNKVQDRIGHEAYGTYFALFALGFLFLAFADLGVNQYVTKSLAGSPEELRGHLPGFFTIKIVLAVIYPLFMAGVGFALGYSTTEIGYLLVICYTHSLAQLVGFFRAGFQAYQFFRMDALASVIDRIFLIVLVLFMLSREITLDSYIAACFISSAVSMVLLYFVLVKQIGAIRPGKGTTTWRAMLKMSMPFAILTVLYSVNDKIDQVMLERIYSKTEAGLYGAAYRWVDAIMMYLWTVLPIFFARFAFHQHSKKEQSNLLRFGQGLAAIPMIFCAVFVWFYGEKLLWQFKGSSPEEIMVMTSCLKILFIAVVVNGIFAIYSTLLTSTGHEKFVGWAIMGSILLNLTLNVILIPQYGAIACAWDTVVAFSVLSVAYVLYVSIRGEVAVPWDILLRIAVAGGLFAGCFYALSRTELDWWIVSMISGVVLMALSFVFKVVQVQKS